MGFVNMVDPGSMCLLTDCLIMRMDSPGGPVDNILNCSETDADAQYRGAKRLDSLSTVAFDAADFGYQRTEPGAKASLKSFGCMPFTRFAACAALAAIEDEMDDRHRNFGQLDVLMGMVRT